VPRIRAASTTSRLDGASTAQFAKFQKVPKLPQSSEKFRKVPKSSDVTISLVGASIGRALPTPPEALPDESSSMAAIGKHSLTSDKNEQIQGGRNSRGEIQGGRNFLPPAYVEAKFLRVQFCTRPRQVAQEMRKSRAACFGGEVFARAVLRPAMANHAENEKRFSAGQARPAGLSRPLPLRRSARQCARKAGSRSVIVDGRNICAPVHGIGTSPSTRLPSTPSTKLPSTKLPSTKLPSTKLRASRASRCRSFLTTE